jgi:predicted RNA-binding Zn-ribbon protein involved in translation (DUF1610 family)
MTDKHMTAEAMPELLPCPFCGGKPTYRIDNMHSNATMIRCDNCPSMACNIDANESRAIAAWNTRHQEAIPQLDPDMPADEMRLHMGELSASEIRVARAAIRWANTAREAIPGQAESSDELLLVYQHGYSDAKKEAIPQDVLQQVIDELETIQQEAQVKAEHTDKWVRDMCGESAADALSLLQPYRKGK